MPTQFNTIVTLRFRTLRRLKKGCAYHYDLLVVGVLNGFLTAYGLPMMHGVLPHSPLHVRSLSDIGEQMEEGHLRQVVSNCRETRVTSIVAHVLLLASLLLIPYPIAYIPRAVLNGLFLYMAVTSLDGLQIFERILLLFTEQVSKLSGYVTTITTGLSISFSSDSQPASQKSAASN